MKKITYEEALKKGLPRYYTGIQCDKAGHDSERYTLNRGCCECNKSRCAKSYKKRRDILMVNRAREDEK